MLLVGSHALQIRHHANRTPRDGDFIATEDEVHQFAYESGVDVIRQLDDSHLQVETGGNIYEFEIAREGTSSWELLQTTYDLHYPWGMNLKYAVADLDTLLLLKMSHRYKKNSKHFNKTMDDIIYLRRLGAKITNPDLLKRREKETYNYSHPNLNQKKNSFFTDEIPYQYDHDSIHRAVAIGDVPAYTHYLKDGAEVMCDKTKWDKLPIDIKLNSVLEESFVLALERSIIPFNTDPYKAFLKSLEKVCTSITSGWWREFAWENYYAVLGLYDDAHNDFVDKFQFALKEGRILPYKGSVYAN